MNRLFVADAGQKRNERLVPEPDHDIRLPKLQFDIIRDFFDGRVPDVRAIEAGDLAQISDFNKDQRGRRLVYFRKRDQLRADGRQIGHAVHPRDRIQDSLGRGGFLFPGFRNDRRKIAGQSSAGSPIRSAYTRKAPLRTEKLSPGIHPRVVMGTTSVSLNTEKSPSISRKSRAGPVLIIGRL